MGVVDRGSTTSAPTGQTGKHWDVVGLNIDESNRRTFLGLLEGKTEAYAKLAEAEEEPEDPAELEFAINVDLASADHAALPDTFLFKNYSRSFNPFYEHINDPDSSQRQLVTEFKESLFPDNNTIPQAFRNHARWLSHLPPLTGTNPLLDASVRAVTLVHIGRLNNSEPFVMESRPYYGQALKLLNKALQDRRAGTSNETLCAVILLSFYEMFASDNNESWIRHAGGVSALMRARGPQRHRHGFDREIFLAYRYTLIIEAFQENVNCFLAEPGWLKLSSDIHSDLKAAGVSSVRVEIFDLAEDYYQSMVVLPELCSYARALWQARQNGTPPPHSRAQILDKLTQHRSNFKSTFGRFEAALKKAGHAPTININHRDPLVGIEYEFINTFVSATYAGYWTVLIVLNLCLQGIQADDKDMVELYRTESKECGLNICRSCTYMLTSSFLGPFFLIFGLRVSLLVYEETDGPEADWILRKLFEIGGRHMGIAKHVPGYRAGITVDELCSEFHARREKTKQRDVGERMEFARRVANGDVFDDDVEDMSGGRPSGVQDRQPPGGFGAQNGEWQGFNDVEDVLQAWEDQDNFQLQSNMHNLNVDNGATFSSRGSTPLPPISTGTEQQFSQAAAAYAMPDMNFFDQSFPESDQTPNNFIQANQSFFAGEQQNYGVPKQFEDQYDPAAYEIKPQVPTRKNTLPRGLERFFQ